jgi:hypothetical protein
MPQDKESLIEERKRVRWNGFMWDHVSQTEREQS